VSEAESLDLATPEIQAMCIAFVRVELEQAGITSGGLWDEAAKHPDLAVASYGKFARAGLRAIRVISRKTQAAAYDQATGDNDWQTMIDYIVGDSK
jgi:hypothetical protein